MTISDVSNLECEELENRKVNLRETYYPSDISQIQCLLSTNG